jgi:hypothetical protein
MRSAGPVGSIELMGKTKRVTELVNGISLKNSVVEAEEHIPTVCPESIGVGIVSQSCDVDTNSSLIAGAQSPT